jgi:hypothetical protein
MLHLYRFLLLLYPSAYRREFAEEMVAVFRQAQRDCSSLGFLARLEFSFREIAGLLVGAFRERTKVSNEVLAGGAMRSFRFPRWMIVGMVLTLLAVLMAIETTRVLSTQGVVASPSWGFLSPSVVLAILTLMSGLGLIGYGVRLWLRHLRRRSFE